jgi:hypothetical protein
MSETLSHWPKTKKQAEEIYNRCLQREKELKNRKSDDTGEISFDSWPPVSEIVINEDLSIDFKNENVNPNDTHFKFNLFPEILVDGCLPFKFGNVQTIILQADLGLKSLIGLPNECEVFSADEGCFGIKIENFENFPKVVKKVFSMYSDLIESTEFFPQTEKDCLVYLMCKNLKDFSHLPKACSSLKIFRSDYFSENDFKYLPKILEQLTFTGLPNLKSLRDLDKYTTVSSFLVLYRLNISSSILSLAKMKTSSGIHVTHSFETYLSNNEKTTRKDELKLKNVIIKYFGSGDPIGFQSELLELGLDDLAQI